MNLPKKRMENSKTLDQHIADGYVYHLIRNIIAYCAAPGIGGDEAAEQATILINQMAETEDFQELQRIVRNPVKSKIFRTILEQTQKDISPSSLILKNDDVPVSLESLEQLLRQVREVPLYRYDEIIHTLESLIKSVLRDRDPLKRTSICTEDVYDFFIKSSIAEAENIISEAIRRSQLPSVSTRTDKITEIAIAKSKEINVLFDSRIYQDLDTTDQSYNLKIGIEGPEQRKKGYEITVSTLLNLEEVYQFFRERGILIEGVLDEKDWNIWIVCNNLFLNGIEYFDVSTIRRLFGYTGKANEITEQDIARRIDKMSRIRVYRQLTYTQRDKKGNLVKEDEHFDIEDTPSFYTLTPAERDLMVKKGEYYWFYLLPVTGGKAVRLNGQFLHTGYRMGHVSDLLTISLEHDQRFSIPIQTLKALKSNRGSTMRDRIFKFLITQIGMKKRDCKYLFSTLCDVCRLETPNQKSRGYKTACEILDTLVASKTIHSYEKDSAPRCRDLYVYKTSGQRREYKLKHPKK